MSGIMLGSKSTAVIIIQSLFLRKSVFSVDVIYPWVIDIYSLITWWFLWDEEFYSKWDHEGEKEGAKVILLTLSCGLFVKLLHKDLLILVLWVGIYSI